MPKKVFPDLSTRQSLLFSYHFWKGFTEGLEKYRAQELSKPESERAEFGELVDRRPRQQGQQSVAAADRLAEAQSVTDPPAAGLPRQQTHTASSKIGAGRVKSGSADRIILWPKDTLPLLNRNIENPYSQYLSIPFSSTSVSLSSLYLYSFLFRLLYQAT